MNDILNKISQLSPFLQGLLAAAVFALSIWLLQVALNRAKRSGKKFVNFYSRDILFKHWVHKRLVRSNQLNYFTFGHFYIFTESFRWIIRAGLTLVFFFGVISLLNAEYLAVLAYYLAFNCLLEASSWLRDWSSDDEVKFINEDLKNEVLNKLEKRAVEHQPEEKELPHENKNS